MNDKKRHDVFISYSQKNRQESQQLQRMLVDRGFSVWLDHDLPPGSDFNEQIRRNLDASESLVVLWSKDAARSPHVRSEVDRALAQNKKVIPVAVESAATGNSLTQPLPQALKNFEVLPFKSERILEVLRSEISLIARDTGSRFKQVKLIAPPTIGRFSARRVRDAINHARYAIDLSSEPVQRELFGIMSTFLPKPDKIDDVPYGPLFDLQDKLELESLAGLAQRQS